MRNLWSTSGSLIKRRGYSCVRSLKADAGNIPIAEPGQQVDIKQYYHNGPLKNFDNNWRIDVRVGKKDFVALTPPGFKPGDKVSFGELELVPRSDYDNACRSVSQIAANVAAGKPIPLEAADNLNTGNNYLSRSHFVPGQYAVESLARNK